MNPNQIKQSLLDVIDQIDTNEHIKEEKTIIDIVLSKQKKKTFEERHTRQTYLIKNELIAELEKISSDKDRGFKTAFINYALEKAIKEANGILL